MNHQVALLVFGILLLLLGLIGKVKAKEIEVGTSSKVVRTITAVLGVVLVVFSFDPNLIKGTLWSSIRGSGEEAERVVAEREPAVEPTTPSDAESPPAVEDQPRDGASDATDDAATSLAERKKQEALKIEKALAAEEARREEERRLADERRRLEQEQRRAEEARREEERRRAEQARREEERRLADEQRRAEEEARRLARSLTPLKLFWSAKRGDNFTTATPRGEFDARNAGYSYIRADACIFKSEDRPGGTVPLKLYWGPKRGDNFTTATSRGEKDAIRAGYSYIRNEGYVYPSPRENTVPLKLFWSGKREDNFTTATRRGEKDALSAGYSFIRNEAYVYPASHCQ